MRTPPVRLFPAPPLEPPFDDQLPPEALALPAGAGAQLTLPWRAEARRTEARRTETRRTEIRHAETGRAETRCAGTRRADAPRAGLPPGATVSGTAGASPAARQAALRFLERCQEILNGYRPASHIRQMSAPTQAQTIVERVAAVARRTTRLPRTPAPGRRPGAVARRHVRVCEPRPGAAEAMAVLTQGSRSWAVAFRLERRGGAWQCTAFTDVIRQP